MASASGMSGSEAGGERMAVAVWYPADLPSGRTVEGPFAMKAARDAPPAGGRFGLVLISHGTGGGRLNHRGTAIRLAQADYIAAALEHSGDSWRDGRYSSTAANWVRRPRQLSAALDRLLADPEFGPRIDPARIAAIGHSAGGYSVLALIRRAGGHDRSRPPLHRIPRPGSRLLQLWPAGRDCRWHVAGT